MNSAFLIFGEEVECPFKPGQSSNMKKADRENKMSRLLGGFDVVCYDDFTVERSLTAGKTYSVLDVQKTSTYTFYKVKCDTRRTKWMSAEFFNPNKKRNF